MDGGGGFADRHPRFAGFQGAPNPRRSESGAFVHYESYPDGRAPWREPDSLGGITDCHSDARGYGPFRLSGLELGGSHGPGIGMGLQGSSGFGGLGIPPLEDSRRPALIPHPAGLDPAIGNPGSFGLSDGRLDHVGRQDISILQESSLLPPDATSTLFVEGIPTDCTRREVAHIFRPFIGFKEVRVVQKDKPGGQRLLLCFVEFADARYAATALEALQGYKFDEIDRNSGSLELQFARAPGRRGARDLY